MGQIRIGLTVDDDIPAMLTELAGSERKMGAYLSGLIRSLHTGGSEKQTAELELFTSALRGLIAEVRDVSAQMKELSAKVKEVDQRLSDLEDSR